MSAGQRAIATVAMGQAAEHLDYTFTSFARNQGIPLHAFILQDRLPARRVPGVEYHLVSPVPDFSHPLREVYFRRLELIDRLDADLVLVVDSYDVLCLQPLPPFEEILGNADVAACVEHDGGRYLMGQGYTPNFLNGGVFFWRVQESRDIREEIVARGRTHFRTVADDQFCINEVIQTKYYRRLRILPGQYNYRAYLNRKQGGWPTVDHLDGVLIYHNGPCIDALMQQRGSFPEFRARAELPRLEPVDMEPLSKWPRRMRSLLQYRRPHLIHGSLLFRSRLFLLKIGAYLAGLIWKR